MENSMNLLERREVSKIQHSFQPERNVYEVEGVSNCIIKGLCTTAITAKYRNIRHYP